MTTVVINGKPFKAIGSIVYVDLSTDSKTLLMIKSLGYQWVLTEKRIAA